jgi:hypothetical protein
VNLNSDEISKVLLESFNYQVKKIPESAKKEADFLVTLENCSDIALIEAKMVIDDKKEYIKKDVTLKNGEIYSYDAKLGINNKISKITSNAKRQLISSSDKEHKYKLIFYVVSGINPHTKAEQIIDTLYGRTRILIRSKNIIKDCFYFRSSKFYSYKDTLDGAIIAEQDLIDKNKFNLILCLNSFSQNFDKIKLSCLIKPFGEAVINPIDKEQSGEIFIPDNDISRSVNGLGKNLENSNYNHIISHINEKYDLNDFLIAIDLEYTSIYCRRTHKKLTNHTDCELSPNHP